MEIKKAIITAAGKSQRILPLQTLVDRDGVPKTALQIIIEEILKTGVEAIAIVIWPGDQQAYETAAGAHARLLTFIEQSAPLGYGHAVYSCRSFTQDQPFLLLVGDHLYLSQDTRGCAQQLVDVARAESCSVSAVQPTHESKLRYYGAVGGRRLQNRQRLYEIESVTEKPTPTEAERRLIVPGLRAGNYLCFFGMHVLTPAIMAILGDLLLEKRASLSLTDALSLLQRKERYLAYEVEGRRYDIGVRYGLWIAQLAFALSGKDRQEVLAQTVELLASRAESAQ